MEMVLATRNKNKIEEIERMLLETNVTILTLDDYPQCPEVEEDQATFEGNALKKATAIAMCARKLAMADDSGLEVYALHSAPGVLSARYAGEDADDRANIKKLLYEMRDVPDGERGARFVCCCALAFPEGKVLKFWGVVEGKIAKETHGRMGFGYDPIFYPSGYEKTFAEMTPQEKDALSHRSIALTKLKDYLKDI